ncbi:MAG: dienelactone hydrolase family protein [Desulfobacterales bacterium]
MKKYALFIILTLLIAVSADAKVVSQAVTYDHEGTVLEGYLAYDDALVGKRPGVLVVHEWWGLGDFVRERVDKLAGLGYVAFALDMYGEGIFTKDPSRAKELSSHLRGKPIMRKRALAGLNVLKNSDRVDVSRIAAVGYCFGGTTVLELAYSGADLAGVVSFHGGLTAAKTEDYDRIKAKFLILHGAEDNFISHDQIRAFHEGMRQSGADWQMIYFGGAVHSFTNPSADKADMQGIAYDQTADKRSWNYMTLFLGEIFSR